MIMSNVLSSVRGRLSPTPPADENMSDYVGDEPAAEAMPGRTPVSSPLTKQKRNVGSTERAVAALAGAGLVALGLRNRSPLGALLTLGGAALIHRGATGYCALYQAMGRSTAEGGGSGVQIVRPHANRTAAERKRDVVQEASEQSFPASDAPAWGGAKA